MMMNTTLQRIVLGQRSNHRALLLRLSASSVTVQQQPPPQSLSRLFHATTTATTAASGNASGEQWHGTTILCVRKGGQVCMMGDGMVSQGSMIVKPNATKIRRIVPKGTTTDDGSSADGADAATVGGGATIVGFAGSTADAFTLLERLETKLDEYPGQLARSCVELAKGWRTDKYLRRLEASLLVADSSVSLELTGNGDVLESHDGVLGVGSGSPYAIAAARALLDSDLTAEEIAKKSMSVAANMCVYTNEEFISESLVSVPKEE